MEELGNDYTKCIEWLRDRREEKVSWESLILARRESIEELNEFFRTKIFDDSWPSDLTFEKWEKVISRAKELESKSVQIKDEISESSLDDDIPSGDFIVPKLPRSAWQLYKKHLIASNFSEESITNIELSSIHILRRLSLSTKETPPIKGLVIGNVQSGKTANMAGLMSMAADYGWNMFIVLSGTIESLRIQTQTRLVKDLNQPGNFQWIGLERLSNNSPIGQRLCDLRLENGSDAKFLTISLKNASRLKSLLKWIHSDLNKKRLLKVLIIDDEADQASINTAKVDKNQRRIINQLIVNLVENKTHKNELSKTPFHTMNYISYTATPYANFLNESSPESLYPRNFVTVLPISNEYFGPEQIFGADSEKSLGMDILRVFDEDKDTSEIDKLKDLHKGDSKKVPKSLVESLCWFLTTVASLRHQNYSKPISMLVHTSSRINDHEQVAQAIQAWIRNNTEASIISMCEEVYLAETYRFNKESFLSVYPEYGRDISTIYDYPDFSLLKSGIEILIRKITPININSEGEMTYHEGIHLCIDNSDNNMITDENTFKRLVYPSTNSTNYPSPAPAFIVVGGNTLSRGLTLEGLVSTYFPRVVKQADTLMQMGRWFGYRRNYEIYPRIWMSWDTYKKFQFLTELDQELRIEIQRMKNFNVKPNQYGPKIINTPKVSWLAVTAKNRMQRSRVVDVDFTGSNTETLMFENDQVKLKNNIDILRSFLLSLGNSRLSHNRNAFIWENIEFDLIYRQLISKSTIHKQGRFFDDPDNLRKWLTQMMESSMIGNWNVCLAGSRGEDRLESQLFELNEYVKVGKIKRSKLKSSMTSDNLIRFSVIRSVSDIVSDVIYDSLTDTMKSIYDRGKYSSNYQQLRDASGFSKTPLLLIYVVDKNSQPKPGSNREALNATNDIVTFSFIMPGYRTTDKSISKLQIRLDTNIKEWDEDED